jgi:hypothetical protein
MHRPLVSPVAPLRVSLRKLSCHSGCDCTTEREDCLSPGREQKYEDGIALLRNALANQSDCVLHRILGDFLVAVNEYQEAMDQYSIALR